MFIQDLANLITIRNFLASSIENLNIRLSRDEIKSVQTRVALLDKTIVEMSLKLDLSRVGAEVMVRHWESTEDVAEVAKRAKEKGTGVKVNSDGSVTVEAPPEQDL